MKYKEKTVVCVWSDLSHGGGFMLLFPQTNVPILDHHDAEEELRIVKFVVCVSFADRIGVGEGIQVRKQVEPRDEVFGRLCCLCKIR